MAVKISVAVVKPDAVAIEFIVQGTQIEMEEFREKIKGMGMDSPFFHAKSDILGNIEEALGEIS